MIESSLVFVALALFLGTPHLQRLFENRLGALEQERMSMVERGLSKEFVFIEPERLRRNTRRVLLGGALLSTISFSPVPILLAVTSVWFIPSAVLKIVTTRRKTRMQQQLTHALPTISASLRAGHTLERAIEMLIRTESPPISQEFELVLKELRFGAMLPEALENLVRRCPLRDLEVMVRAVQISARAGSNLAEAFDHVGEVIRARADLKEKVSALTAQGRLQGWIAIAMPIILMLILHLIAPEYLSPLVNTGTGRLVLALAAVAMLVGGIWIHRISQREFLQ